MRHYFISILVCLLPCLVFSQKDTLSTLQATSGVVKSCEGLILRPGFSFKSDKNKSLSLIIDESVCKPKAQPIGITAGENYILTITPTSPLSYMEVDAINNKVTVRRDQDANPILLFSLQYYDGLGRPTQSIQRNMTPDKSGDWVTLQTYDGYGRNDETWLPTIMKNNGGKYNSITTLKSKMQGDYPNDTKPYSKIIYDLSPLDRVSEQYGAGSEWHNNKKSIRIGYLSNKGKNSTNLSIADSLVCAMLTCVDPLLNTYNYKYVYGTGELFVTRTINEDGNKMYEFKDKEDKLILSRLFSDNMLHDTYYVYDALGRLSAVFPPEASQLIYSNTSQINNDDTKNKYAYLYVYNDRGLCIKKKLPGVDWLYYIYDRVDQLIFSQDGEQRSRNEWSFNISDVFGRPVLTGIIKGYSNIKLGMWDNNLGKDAPKITAKFTQNSTNYGYLISSGSFNLTPTEILEVKYYDNYDFLDLNSIRSTHKYQAKDGFDKPYDNTKDILTGSMVAVLGDAGVKSKIFSAFYYDFRDRVIQAHATNHLGGIESEYYALNFDGQPLQRLNIHTNPLSGQSLQTELYTHTYDHANRPLDTYLSLNNSSNKTLIESISYDDLGRMKINKKGNNEDLATVFSYDIRSRIKSMNSTHLNIKLEYTSGSNILTETWRQSEVDRSYLFEYDGLSRLKKATFSGGISGEQYTTDYTYDRQGNIKNLQRHGKKGASYGLVDNLTYTYKGNQLVNIVDAVVENAKAEAETDFFSQAGSNGVIVYNKNGAMSEDTHKGISSIKYNVVNQPSSITVDKHKLVGGDIKYLYTASGKKVQAIYTENTNLRNVALMGTTAYANGTPSVTTVDYIGNKVYENNRLKRILIPGGYIENSIFYYYLTDHLGNNRAVATASGSIVQRTQYYPFGLSFADSEGSSVQPYKYNGKEQDSHLQLNLLDYEARQYNQQYARFTTVDPHAENYFSWSPYVYVGNNPIRRIDSDGKDWKDKVAGVTIGVITNVVPFSGSLRDQYTPNDRADYNNMLAAVDCSSIAFGGTMTAGGTAAATAGTSTGLYLSLPTGGASAVAGGGVAVGGFAVAAEGTIIMINSLMNKSEGYDRGGKNAEKGTLSETKKAVKAAQEKVGGSLPKGDSGKMGSPQRGNSKKGYRLDPGHPNRPPGDAEAGPHVNWWNYTNGKRGSGGESGAIPIKKEK